MRFWQALVKCPAVSAGLLERLDLADNTLGGDGAEALAEVLCSQPALTHVNLRDCELEVGECIDLICVLEHEIYFYHIYCYSRPLASLRPRPLGKVELPFAMLGHNNGNTCGVETMSRRESISVTMDQAFGILDPFET